MPRAGYDLAVLPLPANIPSWETEATVRAHQALLDGQYLHAPGGLDNYYGQADGYLQTQDVQRGYSSDPRHYLPPPFPLPIPRRQAVAYDEDGTMRLHVLDPDPRIPTPMLPPLPDPAPDTGITGHPPASPDSAVMAELAIIRGQLEQLRNLIMMRA